ncbi:BTB/POZ and MATH domain-containing protein 1-like [Miscanthus floridulus]|uniref:BTB/POZ and MATH domain-containing protein 1-like n=1 Tax=Miscanthus floridulus TaxID=154761 RepID=UPI00345862C8
MSSLARRLLSGSVTVVRQANGSHLHRMDGYSLLEQAIKTGSAVTSSAFSVGGRKWELLLYPNGIDADHRRSVSADLRLAYEDRGHREATATYRVSILDYAGNPAHSRTVGPCRFEGFHYIDIGSSWRTKDEAEERMKMKKTSVDELEAAEELRRSAPFLLRNDRLNVLCDVSVVEKDKRRNKWFMGLDRAFNGFSY